MQSRTWDISLYPGYMVTNNREREMTKKRAMSLKEACDFVPDDLPDGAYWAMAHDIAGADYGEVWGELDGKPVNKVRNHKCTVCNKRFEKDAYMRQHRAAAHKQQGEGNAD
jgi:hypothetical protein